MGLDAERPERMIDWREGGEGHRTLFKVSANRQRRSFGAAARALAPQLPSCAVGQRNASAGVRTFFLD